MSAADHRPPLAQAIRASERPGARDLADRVERWAGYVPLAILVYFAVQTVIRLAISSNLGIDDAEIADRGWFALGYGNSNPPLYDWIALLLMKLTGSWLVALVLAKNLLLAANYLFFFLLGRVLFGNRTGAAVLALAPLMMPQVSWQAQVTLSHSALATAAVAGLVLGLALVIERASLLRFAALGLALGVALLSKYNVAIPVVALALAAATVPAARRRLADWRLLVALAIVAAIVLPHALWALSNFDDSTSRLARLGNTRDRWTAIDIPWLGVDGFFSFATAALVNVGPLLLIWAVGRRLARREPDRAVLDDQAVLFGRVVGRALLIGILGLVVGIVALDVHNVHARYVTPFLMLVPVWLALRFPLALKPSAAGRYLILSGVIAIGITIGWPQTILFDDDRLAFPYEALAAEAATAGGGDAAILMRRSDYALNVARHMANGRVFDSSAAAPTVVALWETGSAKEEGLIARAGPCYRIDGDVREIVARYHYFSGKETRISLALLRRDPGAAPEDAGCALPVSETNSELRGP